LSVRVESVDRFRKAEDASSLLDARMKLARTIEPRAEQEVSDTPDLRIVNAVKHE
jgi:hypothetical protein